MWQCDERMISLPGKPATMSHPSSPPNRPKTYELDKEGRIIMPKICLDVKKRYIKAKRRGFKKETKSNTMTKELIKE